MDCAPDHAPGREISSPWPERIEIRSVAAAGPGRGCVAGEVVYLTSVEMVHGGAALRKPVIFEYKQGRRMAHQRIPDYHACGAGLAPAVAMPSAIAIAYQGRMLPSECQNVPVLSRFSSSSR